MTWAAIISPSNFLRFLFEMRERELQQIPSRNALICLLGEARERGDTREVGRLGKLLEQATRAELASCIGGGRQSSRVAKRTTTGRRSNGGAGK